MEFSELSQKAHEIKEAYDELNQRKGKKVWGVSEYAQGLVGDVGDLLKFVSIKNDFPQRKEAESKLRHELADCLWSVMIISRELEIDLEKEFMINMEYLKQKLRETMEEP